MKSSFSIELKKILTSKKVLTGLFATMILLIFFRIGAAVLLPGISLTQTAQYSKNNSFLELMGLISGSGSSSISFFSIGVSPYITSQIIVQLLSSDVIKPLSKLAKGGEKDRRKIEIITRILTIPFAIAQSYAILSLSVSQGIVSVNGATSLQELKSIDSFKIILALVSGSLVSLFIADMISKRGIGNGITLLIVSGVVSQLIPNFNVIFNQIIKNGSNSHENLISYLSFITYVVLFFILMLGVIMINGAVRKIPIQQTGNSFSLNVNEMAYLPIKVNTAGVIPVIFASSIMTIPSTMMQLINPEGATEFNKYFGLDKPAGMTTYAILIILFSFFYSYVQLNPEQISNNFKKSGKYIAGVKSGTETEKYISKILIRINFIGAPFLALIAIIPYVVSTVAKISSGIAIGGTGIIIIVSGAIDFWQSLTSAETNYTYTKTKKDIQQSYVEDESTENKKVTHLW